MSAMKKEPFVDQLVPAYVDVRIFFNPQSYVKSPWAKKFLQIENAKGKTAFNRMNYYEML